MTKPPHPYTNGWYRVPPDQGYPGLTCFKQGNREIACSGHGAEADRRVLAAMQKDSVAAAIGS